MMTMTKKEMEALVTRVIKERRSFVRRNRDRQNMEQEMLAMKYADEFLRRVKRKHFKRSTNASAGGNGVTVPD